MALSPPELPGRGVAEQHAEEPTRQGGVRQRWMISATSQAPDFAQRFLVRFKQNRGRQGPPRFRVCRFVRTNAASARHAPRQSKRVPITQPTHLFLHSMSVQLPDGQHHGRDDSNQSASNHRRDRAPKGLEPVTFSYSPQEMDLRVSLCLARLT